jgi:hypothetical protein
MKARFLAVVLLASAAFAQTALAQAIARPDVPEAIKAPAGEEVVLVAHATGSQVYTCMAGADGKFAWTLKAPDAILHDKMGAVIGSHFAGPTWKLDDGSSVKGKAAAHADQPDSIPWLLVNVVDHGGAGALARVTTIQRINTKDGKAPATGCDAEHQNQETKSAYTADYYFYAPAKQ